MNNNKKEYFTLKDIILKISTYGDVIRENLKWVIIIGVILGLLFAMNAYLKPTMYKEELTFMMDEQSGSDLGAGLGALKGLLGGKRQKGTVKILQLFQSKYIINNTLFDTTTINGKSDCLANHFLEEYTVDELVKGYRKFGRYKAQWPKELLKNESFRFQHANVDSFGIKENMFLRILYEKIVGNSVVGIPSLLESKLDEESGIMTLMMNSEREEITLGILNNIYVQLSAFFIEKSIEKELRTFEVIKYKKDSVYTALRSAEYRLANFKDRNHNIVTLKGKLEQGKIEREVSLLNSLYIQHVMQMESTDFALRNKMPVVQVIDLPRRPISPQRESILRNLALGGIGGAILVIVFLIIRKFFRDILEEDEEWD